MAYNWNTFGQIHDCSDTIVQGLKTYANMIIEWNKKFNLTAITKEEDIATLHFEDSLALKNIINLNNVDTLADIGTGAGIPAIPLKICYPHMNIILIEVNSKKRTFLEAVIDTLQLPNVEIVAHDWRTFLRNTDYTIDLFCARASLAPEELTRIFKDTSPYKDSTLVYWASKHWIPSPNIQSYISQTYTYSISSRTYNLIKMENLHNK